jgi:hypothetical protein
MICIGAEEIAVLHDPDVRARRNIRPKFSPIDVIPDHRRTS